MWTEKEATAKQMQRKEMWRRRGKEASVVKLAVTLRVRTFLENEDSFGKLELPNERV